MVVFFFNLTEQIFQNMFIECLTLCTVAQQLLKRGEEENTHTKQKYLQSDKALRDLKPDYEKLIKSCPFVPHMGIRVLLNRTLVCGNISNALIMHTEMVMDTKINSQRKWKRTGVFSQHHHLVTTNGVHICMFVEFKTINVHVIFNNSGPMR